MVWIFRLNMDLVLKSGGWKTAFLPVLFGGYNINLEGRLTAR